MPLACLFSEVLRSLDIAESSANADLVVGRSAVFASYWTLAGQVMSGRQRAELEQVLCSEAGLVGLKDALPSNAIASRFIAYSSGDWVPWTASLASLPVLLIHNRVLLPGCMMRIVASRPDRCASPLPCRPWGQGIWCFRPFMECVCSWCLAWF
jgi:hypothetical protein